MDACKLVPYTFHGNDVRIGGTPDRPLFVAADVCRVLAIKNNRDALEKLDDDEKGVAITDTLGGPQQLLCVTESGLYSLIFRSRKAEARKFRRWVTEEVLPAIHRTGGYGTAAPPPPAAPPSRLQLAEMVIALEREKEALERQNERLLPDAKFGQELMDSDGLFSINQVAKPLGVSAIRLNRFLNERRVIYNQSGEWMPYAAYDQRGYFRIVAVIREVQGDRAEPTVRTFHQLKVTPQGRAFIHRLWRECGALAAS